MRPRGAPSNELAARLGLARHFRPGAYAEAEEILARIAGLGLRKLRVEIGWSEYLASGGRTWYGWLVPRLAERFELLAAVPCDLPARAGTGGSSDAQNYVDFVDHLAGRFGAAVAAMELPAAPPELAELGPAEWSRALAEATGRVRARNGSVVLGGVSARQAARLAASGALDGVHALGLRRGGGDPSWPAVLAELRDALPASSPALWITEAGLGTRAHDPYGQVVRFRDALAAAAERIYWPASRAASEDGLFAASGQPSLLARLLRDGSAEKAAQIAELGQRAPSVVGRAHPVLVTGGAGFIGSNLADRLAADGHDVLVFDALARPGVEANLAWLKRRHPARISAAIGDVRDADAVAEAAGRAQAVFHLAAQVAVTTSLVDPALDFDVNLRGTFHLLDALRRRGDKAPLVFASTNKVYGDLGDVALADESGAWLPADPELRAHGIDESRPLDFHTPYGCSKGAADQYVLDAARSFGVPTAVLRMSCIYGPRQLGTEDQGWLAHFLISAIEGRPLTIYGDGRQVRDVLEVEDAVAAYLAAWRNIGAVAGRAFNLGGGPDNAVTLRQVIAEIERITGRPVATSFSDWRQGDQRYFVADTRLARAELGLRAPLPWKRGLQKLARFYAPQLFARAPASAMAGGGA